MKMTFGNSLPGTVRFCCACKAGGNKKEAPKAINKVDFILSVFYLRQKYGIYCEMPFFPV